MVVSRLAGEIALRRGSIRVPAVHGRAVCNAVTIQSGPRSPARDARQRLASWSNRELSKATSRCPA